MPTVAKPNPLSSLELEDDPEKANPTRARASNPLKGRKPPPAAASVSEAEDEPTNNDQDPERHHKTSTRAPPGRSTAARARKGGSSRVADNPRSSAVEVSQSLQEESDADYHTGQNFRSMHDADDEAAEVAASMSLEGDGLEPMDPEMVPRTRQLPLDEENADEPSAVDQVPSADDDNATRAGPPVQLEITAGPDAGQKRRFKGVRMVIGRTPGVDLQLSDQSVSRRHIELVHGDAGTVLRDLGSGNGTRVNGTKITEKVLEHGDEIAIGKTRIRYIDEMAAFKQAREESEKNEAEAAAAEAAAEEPSESEAEAPAEDSEAAAGDGEGEGEAAPEKEVRSVPVRTARGMGIAQPDRKAPAPMRMLIIGGAVLVVIILVVGLLNRKPLPTPAEINNVKAEQLMQVARNAVRESKFQEAASAAEEAERLSPGIDRSKLGASAREEVTVQQSLDQARALLEKKQFEDVRKVMATSPKGSGRLDEQKTKLEADLVAAELQYKKDQIDLFIAGGDIEPAKRLLGALPVEEQGPSARKIADFENQLDELKKDEERAARQNAAASAAAKKQRRSEEVLLAFAAVERKFAGAEWDRAASECNRVVELHQGDSEIMARAQKLRALIPNFGRNYEEGMRKTKQGQSAQAAKPLRAAHQLYGQIGLRQNAFGAELEQNLAQAALSAGREALLRHDLATAAVNFRDVVRLDPSEARGRQGLDETIAKAEDLFHEAYTLRALDPRDAVRKLKVVIEVTPVGSATHEKAKNQLQAMPQ